MEKLQPNKYLKNLLISDLNIMKIGNQEQNGNEHFIFTISISLTHLNLEQFHKI